MTNNVENIEIIHANSVDYMWRMEKESVEMILTDPPYFLDGLGQKWSKGKNIKKNKSQTVGGLPAGMKFDKNQGKNLQGFIGEACDEMIKIIKPGGFALFFSQPRLSHRMAVGIEDAGFDIRDMYAWSFSNQAQFKAFGMDNFIEKMKDLHDREKDRLKAEMWNKRTPQFRPKFETIIMAQKPKEGTHVENWIKHKTGSMNFSTPYTTDLVSTVAPETIMKFDKDFKDKFNTHPTVKPVCLMEHLIYIFSDEGQTVFDPFLGSGTTALACQRTNRKCIGIEIDPEYVEIAKRRVTGG